MFYSYNPADKENRKTMIWISILFAAILWTGFEAPLSFVLESEVKEHNLWWDTFFCLIFTFDIYFRLTNKLKLPESTKRDLMHLPKKNRPYHKSLWLPIDIITSLPFDIIVSALGLSAPGKVLRLLRLCRVIRIIKLRSLLHVTEFLPKILKIGLIISVVMLAIHMIACGWMLITPRPELDHTSFYNISLYWAISTLTTVGYGDITPDSNIGRLYTMGVMIVGVGVYGIIIGNFSRMMMLADKYTEERKEKMNSLAHFMKYYNIPRGLQRQVFSFYNHLLNKNLSEEDSQIINDLPNALQNDLQIYMKIKLIKNVPIFKDSSLPCLKMIAAHLDQTFHNPNEYIVRKGDIGEEMFIIGHGEVEVMAGEKVVAQLKQGQFFGEFALLEDTIRTADVQTKAYCDIHTFKKEDFLEVIEKYPELGKKFQNTYRKRESDLKEIESSKNKAA